jgi:hypothetical protein
VRRWETERLLSNITARIITMASTHTSSTREKAAAGTGSVAHREGESMGLAKHKFRGKNRKKWGREQWSDGVMGNPNTPPLHHSVGFFRG